MSGISTSGSAVETRNGEAVQSTYDSGVLHELEKLRLEILRLQELVGSPPPAALSPLLDPTIQVTKGRTYTAQATGANIWIPSPGKRIAITSLFIGSYATTAARLILWFGHPSVTVYVADPASGSHQEVFAASFVPSATSYPGAIPSLLRPIFAVVPDQALKITTDAGMSVDVVVHGYETG